MNESKYTVTQSYNLVKFTDLVAKAFSLEEMETDLIFPLDLSGEVAGETKKIRANNLVTACDRRDKIPELLAECKKHRPEKPWDTVVSHSDPQPIAPDSTDPKLPKPSPETSEPSPETSEPSLVPLEPSLETSEPSFFSKIPYAWWLVVLVLFVVLVLGTGLGWLIRSGHKDAVSFPLPANVKERFDFESDSSDESMVGWSLKTCPSLDTSQCGWLNADEKLSIAESGFSGEKSLQIEATLVNANQIYTVERCFDSTRLEGISASIYIPARENNEQSLAATRIYLLARPQGDHDSTKQWPTSVFDLNETGQSGWYQVFLDLSQVANEKREPFNTQFLDCVHIDLILPATAKNEQVTFFVDEVALYQTISSHALTTNIPPKGFGADSPDVLFTHFGDGLVFNFEDGVIDDTFWIARNSPIYTSRDRAYQGVYSMAIDAYLEEHEGFFGTQNACVTMRSTRDYSLRNKIIISRIYIPEDAPDNLLVQYRLIGSDSWTSFSNSLSGQWNTFVWYTANAPEEVDVELCIILADREAQDGTKNSYDGAFYIDNVEVIPYSYVYFEEETNEEEISIDTFNALKPVNYFTFEDEILPDGITVPDTNIENKLPNTSFGNENTGLRLDLNLPPAGESAPTTENSARIILSTNRQPVEAAFVYMRVSENSGDSISVTFKGLRTDGLTISQTFPIFSDDWVSIFWPTRAHDFDTPSNTPELEHITIYITSREGYKGPVFFDYLATYEFFP
jgi:hypothetical protein